jgi:hypothetical protein
LAFAKKVMKVMENQGLTKHDMEQLSPQNDSESVPKQYQALHSFRNMSLIEAR